MALPRFAESGRRRGYPIQSPYSAGLNGFWDLSTPMARIRGFRPTTNVSRIPLRCIRATSRTHIPRTLALRRANRRMRRADQGLRCLSPQGEFAKHPARRIRRAGIAAGDATAGRASLLTFLRAQESKSPAGARPGRRMMAQATMPRNHCNRDLADSVQAVRGSGIDRRPESALSADQPMIPGFRYAASGLVCYVLHPMSSAWGAEVEGRSGPSAVAADRLA